MLMLWLVIFFKKKILSISFLTEKLFPQRTNKQQNNVPEMFMLANYYRMNRPPPKKRKKGGLGRQILMKMQATCHKIKNAALLVQHYLQQA